MKTEEAGEGGHLYLVTNDGQTAIFSHVAPTYLLIPTTLLAFGQNIISLLCVIASFQIRRLCHF